MGNAVIQTRDLTKKYKNFTAVDSLNLEVQNGEVFGCWVRMEPVKPPRSSCCLA